MDELLFYKEFYVVYANEMLKSYLEDQKNHPEIKDGESHSGVISAIESTIKAVETAYVNKKKGMLKRYFNCVMEYVNEAPEYLIIHRAYFMEKFGFDIMELNKRKMNKINKIVERGNIKSDNEYRAVSQYVDELCQTDGDPAMIEKLNQLLLDYEDRKGGRR